MPIWGWWWNSLPKTTSSIPSSLKIGTPCPRTFLLQRYFFSFSFSFCIFYFYFFLFLFLPTLFFHKTNILCYSTFYRDQDPCLHIFVEVLQELLLNFFLKRNLTRANSRMFLVCSLFIYIFLNSIPRFLKSRWAFPELNWSEQIHKPHLVFLLFFLFFLFFYFFCVQSLTAQLFYYYC